MLRQDLPAASAWVAAERCEFLKRPAQAIAAYQQCAVDHATSLAGAESLLRLAELAWLERKNAAASKAAFTQAEAAMSRLADSADKPTRAWALFRLGMIARVYREDIPAARELWKRGENMDAPGGPLCRQATFALSDTAPIVCVGDTPEPQPVRVASLNLGGEKCFWRYTDGRRHKAVGYLYGPVIGSSFTSSWWGPMNRWYYYLWYPSSHYRPGIGWAVVTLDGKTDLVWCKFTSETSPKP